jgi:hypothetical protein
LLPAPVQHADVANDVRREVSTRFTRKPRRNHEESSLSEDSDEEPETPPRRKKSKKGKFDHWPNNHIYSSGQKIAFEELSWQQFLNGYLTAVRLAAPAEQVHMYTHLGLISEDLLSYPFQAVRAYHGVWLQEIEQGRVQWADHTTRNDLRRRYIWTPATTATRPHQQQARSDRPSGGRNMPTRGKGNGSLFSKNQHCPGYQTGKCKQSRDHNQVDHICKYCLLKLGRRSRHPMKDCRSMPDSGTSGF